MFYVKIFLRFAGRCSKKSCGSNDRHDVYDFEEIYESCKHKYLGWKEGKETTLGTLSKQVKAILYITEKIPQY